MAMAVLERKVKTMKNFEGFGLSPKLLQSLEHMNYSEPTPIQQQAIPLALEGRDIMGSAQTGTGKTAAFAIPLIERLLRDPDGTALVLTPTRELGKQIMDIMHQLLGPKSKIKTAFIIGGEAMGKQYAQLRARPRLIVGTPGRINDHLERGTLELDKADFLVLDETDRMLDMGFTIQLERIFEYMPEIRQTLMFSATLPKNILQMSHKYMNNPERVSVGETNVVAQNIKQEVIRIEQDQKYQELQTQLLEREGSVIVFVKTKFGADRMATNLRRDGFTSEALHGDLRQSKRDRVMQNFRKQNFRILIATDIAARGLDVPHIEHVVNYDLPQVAEDFIHRMGRTARAGAKGSAISFVSNAEWRKWHAIERLINPDAANERFEEPEGGKRKGRRRNDRSKPRNKKFAGQDRDANSFSAPKREERSAERSRPAEKPVRAKRDDFNRADNSNGDFKKTDRKNTDFKKKDSRSAEYKKPDFKKKSQQNKSDFKKSDRRFSEEDNQDFKKPRSKSFEGRKSDRPQRDGQQDKKAPRSDFKKPDFKKSEFQKPGGKKPTGKKPFNTKSDGNKPMGRKTEGKKPFAAKSGRPPMQGKKRFTGGKKKAA